MRRCHCSPGYRPGRGSDPWDGSCGCLRGRVLRLGGFGLRGRTDHPRGQHDADRAQKVHERSTLANQVGLDAVGPGGRLLLTREAVPHLLGQVLAGFFAACRGEKHSDPDADTDANENGRGRA